MSLIGLLNACDNNSLRWKTQMRQLASEQGGPLVRKVVKDFLGGDAPNSVASPSSVPSSEASNEEFSSQAAKNAKSNAEILKEVLLVVFMREPKDRGEFGNWVDTLNQGASLEGVYNGLTHSSDYRKLEFSSSAASISALKIFGEELAVLELELPVATEFDSNSASPLPTLGTVDPVSQTDVVEFGKTEKAIASPGPNQSMPVLAEKYSKQFAGASIYILKRVISDEALKVIAAKNQYREKLATWYSKWAVRMVQRNVDFGISLRNKADESFHYKWAVATSVDRIQWEVINRLQRVLNEANKLR